MHDRVGQRLAGVGVLLHEFGVRVEAGRRHGLKWLQTAGPSDIIKTVPEGYLLGDRALYLASFNKVREAIALDGIMSDEGPRTALKALTSFDPNIKADRIELAKTYTNEFVRRAKDRFKA